MPNPPAEEEPQDSRICKEANDIPQHQLRPNPPVKEPKVARVSKDAINSISDKLVRLRFPCLHLVVEARTSVEHGY